YTAATEMLESANAANIEALERAIATETDSRVRRQMERALAASVLRAFDASDEDKIAAIKTIADMGDNNATSILTPLTFGTGPVADAAKEGLDRVQTTLKLWSYGQDTWN